MSKLQPLGWTISPYIVPATELPRETMRGLRSFGIDEGVRRIGAIFNSRRVTRRGLEPRDLYSRGTFLRISSNSPGWHLASELLVGEREVLVIWGVKVLSYDTPGKVPISDLRLTWGAATTVFNVQGLVEQQRDLVDQLVAVAGYFSQPIIVDPSCILRLDEHCLTSNTPYVAAWKGVVLSPIGESIL